MTRHAYLLDANVFVAAWKLYYRRSFAQNRRPRFGNILIL